MDLYGECTLLVGSSSVGSEVLHVSGCLRYRVSLLFFFVLSYVRGRVHERFFCPDELTHSPRAWILVFSGVEFCGGEFTRCIFLNEPLLTVAISPVRSAARTSTSLRVLAAVDRSTELKCCGPFVPRCK